MLFKRVIFGIMYNIYITHLRNYWSFPTRHGYQYQLQFQNHTNVIIALLEKRSSATEKIFQHHAMFTGKSLESGDVPENVMAYTAHVPDELR